MKVQNQAPIKTGTAPAAAQAKKAQRSEKAEAAAGQKETRVSSEARESARAEISTKAKEMSLAKKLAQSAPDIREEKVQTLKDQIAQGKYEVNPEAIADRMVDEHLAL